MMRFQALASIAVAVFVTLQAGAADLSATVQKPQVDVHAEARFESPRIATLQRNDTVRIAAQQGLWYQLRLDGDEPGFVRVNDVRVAYAATEGAESNVRALAGGKSGAGRVTETAGVRGIDAGELQTASHDQPQLDAMTAQRVDVATAASAAAANGWQATPVAYAAEARPAKKQPKAGGEPPPSNEKMAGAVSDVLGVFGVSVDSKLKTAARALPKSEAELAAEEVALGPAIAGRILGARPLWADAAAQRRVNVVGRWVASQTARADLPWSFAVIDTPDVNAFAAPGGYVLLTRGLYELLASDAEVAAAIAHELSHCVERDHYEVIRKQELAAAGKDAAARRLDAGTGSVAGDYARRYAEQYGAGVMLTTLDREAEYRSDQAAEIYVARAGMNPLALYAVLQKMAALGTESGLLAQLQETHPSLDARMDRIDRRGYAGLEAWLGRE